MNVPLPGFSAQRLLRSSPDARVYQARRDADGRDVIAKVFRVDDRMSEARVEHEFRLLQSLEIDGVVRALSLERAGDELVLLLDRIPGVDLREFAKGQALSLEDFVEISVGLARVLTQMHARRVIHRDIKPSNIVFEPEQRRIYYADFGISVLLEQERRNVYEPALIAGTLPYISPEQTGRTEHEVDFRSDLYSLGVTLYELLAGKRPFESSAPSELLHAHLARLPQPIRELRSEAPRLLCEIVMRLLEKAPEHRYQSAQGLTADLERFAESWKPGQAEPEFELGEHDFSLRLQLPRQLYGRDTEQRVLERELAACAAAGSPRLVLLRGGAGMGKSALIEGLASQVLGEGGTLARGSYSPEHPTPYLGFVEALTALVEQLLTLDDRSLASWRTRLSASLGSVAGVAVELVPPLALVLPEVEPVAKLEPDEAQARLLLVVARLLAAFTKHAPVVLALDDMQWADASSLKLLRELLIGAQTGPVLLIATTREQTGASEPGAAPAAPSLATLTKQLAGTKVPLCELELNALAREQLVELLADTLARPPAELAALAELIERKTANNPLRVRQFLLRLEELELLRPGPRGWVWTLADIAAVDIPDDLVEFMRAKLAELEPALAELIQTAACIGLEFELPVLASISDHAELELIAALYELVELGLLAPLGSRYRFSHGDIREAARAQLEPERARRLRAQIAELLLARLGDTPELLGERVYEVVEHLFAGIASVGELSADQRRKFAALGAAAGERALHAAAWEASHDYLRRAVELIEPEARDDQAFELHFDYAQALALTGATAEAKAAFEALLGWQLPFERYGHVVARRVRITTLQQRYDEALDMGLAGLARCGFSFSRDPSLVPVIGWSMRAWFRLRKLDLDALMGMPEAKDAQVRAAMYICTALKPPAYVRDINLFAALTGFQAFLVARYGFHPAAPAALSQFGIALTTALNKPHEAGVLADHSLELASRTSLPTSYSRALANAVLMIWPNCRPWAHSVSRIPEAQRVAREAGDIEMAGFVAAIGLGVMEQAGMPLSEVIERGDRWLPELEHWGTPEMVIVLGAAHSHARVLAGVEGEPPLTHAQFVEREYSAITIHAAGINRSMRELLLGDPEAAELSYTQIEAGSGRWLMGNALLARMAVVGAILATHLLARGHRREARARMRRCLKLAKSWAAACPENFAAGLELVRAEDARMRGQHARAQAAYERARVGATRAGTDSLAGLALERLADMARANDQGATAYGAAHLALSAYRRWGATAVTRRLEGEYAETLRRYASEETHSRSTHSSTRAGTLADATMTLDVASLLDTLTLNEELELDTLVARVLDRAVTHAGADRGTLLLELGDQLVVVASGDDSKDEGARRLAEPLPPERAELPTTLINYVVRTAQSVVLDDAQTDARFASDPYVRSSGVRALLCMPILKHGRAVGALVLENRLAAACFTSERTDLLRLLAGQAAGAFDNARLYGALQRSEAQWRSLVDGVPDVITLIGRDGLIEFINHLSPFSVDPSTFFGQPADGHMAPPFQRAWRQLFAEVLETGERRELEVHIQPTEHATVWYLIRLAPVRIDGEIAKVLSISTDITMRKLAEVERSEFEAQLRQQQRLEAVGTLAAGIAHEINNPIQGIMNFAELLSDTPDDAALVTEFVAEITAESQRMASIIRNLLAFSRQDDAQALESAKVATLVNKTTPLIRSVLRKDGVKLEVELPEPLPEVACRPQQIQQILMNLIVNARDALNEGRGPDPKHKWVRVTAATFEREAEHYVRISVSDNAGGIPDAVRLKIFDPFFTTKGKEQGTGLGLSVSHGIATEHGGDLWVETELGVGSSFHLELRVHDQA